MIEGSHKLCNKIAKSKNILYQHLLLISVKRKFLHIKTPSTSHIMHAFKNERFYITLLDVNKMFTTAPAYKN